MTRIAMLLLCLACAGHGRRVQTSTETLQVDHSEKPSNSLQALAMLLLASDPAAAFQLSGATARIPGANRISQRAPVLTMAEEVEAPGENQPMQVVTTPLGRREMLQTVGAVGAAASLGANPLSAKADGFFGGGDDKLPPTWESVSLPINSEDPPILFDITFDNKDPTKGWIVGNRGTLLITKDAGKTWKSVTFQNLDQDEEINYRFTQVSFIDSEGWIIGKPAILLHTRDNGQSWERVPLNPKLPGDPFLIKATGNGQAEMATTAGGIYYTKDTGRLFKAQVKETVDATLNRVSSSGVQGASYFSGTINSIQRDEDGSYLAVSSRGNFYLTWKPGDDFWVPHNRESSRRITAMGFVKDRLAEGLWQTTAGGDIWKTNAIVDSTQLNIPFDKTKIRSAGYGILDVAFRPDGKTAWAVGGSGNIFYSKDNGESWKKDKSADDLPTNLYKIKFFGDRGYALGSNGVLLKTTEKSTA